MPRLPNSILRHARAINPLYPLLLQTCRTIPCAHNELRWLREHVSSQLTSRFGSEKDVPERLKHRCVARLARRRARGEPLQYLLGSQPFGELDIKCERGVLIPRQCTESSTSHLARIITSQLHKQRSTPPRRLIVVDFCTGTGCIPLLLLSLLSKSFPDTQIDITGVDISKTALKLARRNYIHNLSHYPDTSRHTVTFEKVDVLDPTSLSTPEKWLTREQWLSENHAEDTQDTYKIVVSNPPYISARGFEKQTERSVRNYEPKLALVPERFGGLLETTGGLVQEWDAEMKTEDIFYEAIRVRALNMGAKIMLFEVAGTKQALRIARDVMQCTRPCWCCPRDGRELAPGHWKYGEIWGDEPEAVDGCVEDLTENEKKDMAALPVRLKGAGIGRSLFFSQSVTMKDSLEKREWEFR